MVGAVSRTSAIGWLSGGAAGGTSDCGAGLADSAEGALCEACLACSTASAIRLELFFFRDFLRSPSLGMITSPGFCTAMAAGRAETRSATVIRFYGADSTAGPPLIAGQSLEKVQKLRGNVKSSPEMH